MLICMWAGDTLDYRCELREAQCKIFKGEQFIMNKSPLNPSYGVAWEQYNKNACLSLVFPRKMEKVLIPGYTPIKDGRRLS